ncbi:MAG: carboxylesterase family protein [Myxococcota bacterium]
MPNVVEISSGKLQGESLSGATVFRGVPYAAPPTGKLRFRAPEPAAPWAGVREAVRFGHAAPQSAAQVVLVRRMIGVPEDRQSQDCLTLNVWTPAPDSGRRPVLVWIHGGAFTMGAGSGGLYDGRRLAKRGDVVVVTINYRLGVLGFLNHPELRALGFESNLGLRDQIRALEWVRENIAGFGGDPDNVTIFGESAGGMSVGTLLATPRANGLFHRAVLQSGALHNVSTEAQSSRVAESLLDTLGVDPTDPGALREVPVSRLVRQQREAMLRQAVTLLPWQPSVDGELLPKTALAALEAGEVARVPTLVGSNRDEWRLFMLADRAGRNLDDDGLVRRLQRQLGSVEDAQGAIEFYRGLGHGPEAGRVWERTQGDRVFHHPAQRAADGLAELGVPVWRYLFSWRPPVVGRFMGACHGLELPFVFGTLRARTLRGTLGVTRGARSLSSRMQEAWIAFARSGNPGHARLPEWSAYDTGKRRTIEFNAESRIVSAPFSAESGFWMPRLG